MPIAASRVLEIRVERMRATARSVELRSFAQAIADALPPAAVEVVLTGSVSRGVADEISDIEMLIVTEGSSTSTTASRSPRRAV